jgi:hypothetical protein
MPHFNVANRKIEMSAGCSHLLVSGDDVRELKEENVSSKMFLHAAKLPLFSKQQLCVSIPVWMSTRKRSRHCTRQKGITVKIVIPDTTPANYRSNGVFLIYVIVIDH